MLMATFNNAHTYLFKWSEPTMDTGNKVSLPRISGRPREGTLDSH